MTDIELKTAFEKIHEQEKKYNVKIDFSEKDIIDKDHLNCLWYGGDIGAIEFEDGWKLVIGVYGDVRVYGRIDGTEVECKDKGNGGNAYWEIARGTENGVDDARLAELEGFDPDNYDEDNYLEFEDNNWVEIDAITPNGTFIDLCGVDNVLDNNILDAFTDIEYALGYLDCAKEIATTDELD